MPDLVPDRQVNVASALVGLMRLIGVIAGATIVATGASTGNYALPLIVIGLIEAGLALVTVLTVREGPHAKPREGRSWSRIALEAWGTDALRERSFVYMTLTRLMFLAGPSIFVNLSLYYMEGSMALTGSTLQFWLTVGTLTIGIGTVVGTVSSAWIAQRLGRKTVAWAAAVICAVGIVLIVRAASPLEAVPGLVLLGLGSGTYIAVDWALMTSTIPKVSSGRYMGLANIANSISGPIGLIVGGFVLDAVTRSAGLDAGPRAATLVGLIFLIAAVLLLIPVQPRVEPPGELQLEREAVLPA